MSLAYKLYLKLSSDFILSDRNILLEEKLQKLEKHETIKFNTINDLINNYYSKSIYLPFQFQNESDTFESILRKIHINRINKNLLKNIFIIKLFLLCGYLNTNDIRYFNELLNRTSRQNEDCFLIAAKRFQENTKINGLHIHPYSDCKIEDENEVENILDKVDIKSIGLLGHPFGFKRIRSKLHKIGYKTRSIHIQSFNPGNIDSAYSLNFLKRFIMFSNIGIFLSKVIGLIPKNCRVLRYGKDDPRLGHEIRKEKIDLSLHRLYGIIRSNIINNSGLGIINDHVGYLPYFRGMSTIDYSIIHGFPIAASIHIIDKGVDTGAILKTFLYRPSQGMSFKDIESVILSKSEERILEVVKMIDKNKIITKKNKVNLGRQYYNIHPTLSFYIKELCKQKLLNLDYEGIQLHY